MTKDIIYVSDFYCWQFVLCSLSCSCDLMVLFLGKWWLKGVWGIHIPIEIYSFGKWSNDNFVFWFGLLKKTVYGCSNFGVVGKETCGEKRESKLRKFSW